MSSQTREAECPACGRCWFAAVRNGDSHVTCPGCGRLVPVEEAAADELEDEQRRILGEIRKRAGR